ncbi:MAG TPA: kelch repeat-containing protein [Candidatus Kapabacteria bacterium]|nr:kelch repeat-containing protein [Candidatus Kapabacteria bacterium]
MTNVFAQGKWASDSTNGFTVRAGLTACTFSNKIYVFGGYDNATYLNTLEIFDPSAHEWSTPKTTGTFTARRGLCSAIVNGKIYLIGGYDGKNWLNTLEVFDPVTNEWSTPVTQGTLAPREKFCCAVVNDKIYVFDGYDGINHLNSVQVFDPAINTWSTPSVTGTSVPRRGVCAVIFDGKIYVMGGFNGNEYLNIVEIFDPATNEWTTPAATGTFTARGALCAGAINNVLYTIGGVHYVSPNYIPLSTLEALDPLADRWTSPATMGALTPRYELTAAVLNGSIYVFGGRTLNNFLNTVEVFTPSSDNVVSNTYSLDMVFFPNPSGGVGVSRATNITVRSSGGYATLCLYDIKGNFIYTLMDGPVSAGEQTITINTSNISPGTYFCKFETNGTSLTKEMIVVR